MLNTNLTLKNMFELINVEVPKQFQNMEFPSHTATDSRYVSSGDAFVALEGEKTDGHKFIPQAISNGAKIIIAKKYKDILREVPENIPVIQLDNPENDLALLASERLKKYPPHEIIAITGSVGKTTTRSAIELLLRSKYIVHAPEKSFNTLLTCSTTILSMPVPTEILLLEFGANKPGEISELTQFFSPTIAVLTAVAPVHLEGFKSVQNVLHEKLQITHSQSIRNVFFNNDNIYLQPLNHTSHYVSVGNTDNSDYKISFDNSIYSLPALSFTLENTVTHNSASFTVNAWGNHIAIPLSLASSVANTLGIPLNECSNILRNFKPMIGRGRIVPLHNNTFLIDDAYNANPMSMRASLETFTNVSCNGKLAVLGEMREMGINAPDYHRALKSLIEKIDFVILVGDTWRKALPDINTDNIIFVDDWQQALDHVNQLICNNDIHGILVKGSNSLNLSNIVNHLEVNS